MQTGFLSGAGSGLGDRTYCLVSIKVIEVYGKSPQFTETNVCLTVIISETMYSMHYHNNAFKNPYSTSGTFMSLG